MLLAIFTYIYSFLYIHVLTVVKGVITNLKGESETAKKLKMGVPEGKESENTSKVHKKLK